MNDWDEDLFTVAGAIGYLARLMSTLDALPSRSDDVSTTLFSRRDELLSLVLERCADQFRLVHCADAALFLAAAETLADLTAPRSWEDPLRPRAISHVRELEDTESLLSRQLFWCADTDQKESWDAWKVSSELRRFAVCMRI